MLRHVFISFSVMVAFVAYDLSRIKIPEETLEPLNVRIFLYVQKLYQVKGGIGELFGGKEYRYEQWVRDKRTTMTPHQPKPDRIEHGMKISDAEFNGVPVRIYDPVTRPENEGAFVWIHGGGWVISSIDANDGLCREAALEMGVLVVSVEYRLAPQYPFPAALDDCYAAVRYLSENAADYQVDPSRIAVAGGSAGGNLAAAVALRFRDEEVAPPIKLQVLLYPVVQSINFNLPSYKENEHDALLPRDTMVAMWLFYAQGDLKNFKTVLNNQHAPRTLQRDVTLFEPVLTSENTEYNETVWNDLKDIMLNPYFAPLMANDLTGLPRALVYTVEQDILKDEGSLYAKKLKEAGNKVEHYHNKGGFHGLNAWGLPFHEWVKEDARRSNTEIRNFVKTNL